MSEHDEHHGWPQWARELAAHYDRKKPPRYVNVYALPELAPKHRPDVALDYEVGGGLAAALHADYMGPHPLALRAAEGSTPESRASFGRALLDVWGTKGYTRTYRWMLWAQVWFGGTESVLELERLVEDWVFGTSAQRDRACDVIAMLGRLGSPEALTIVDRYRQIERSPKVHGAATLAFRKAAEARGVSTSELEDLIVPDYGLDAHGSRTFSYGERSFSLVFREGFYPALRAEDGTVFKSPPRGLSSDDSRKVGRVRQQWGQLNEMLKRAVRVHRTRIERRMVSGKRTRFDAWRDSTLTHPFMQHFARNLLWGVYSAYSGGELLSLFCVSEDLSMLDADDEHVTLPDDAIIGLPHPLELSQGQLASWSQLFADDERFSPFEQLDRTTYDAGGAEITTRYEGVVFQPRALRTYFKYQGFIRGNPDYGFRRSYWKSFEGTPWRYTIHLSPGLNVGSYEHDVEQSVSSVSFARHETPGTVVPLADVPTRFVSEAIRDIERILSSK